MMGRAGLAVLMAAMLVQAALAGSAPVSLAQPVPHLLEMVSVPGGTFLMGDNVGDGRSDEKPVHRVTVSDFALSKYEVTVGQFRRFVAETGYRTSAERQGGWLVWNGAFWEHKRNASWKKPYFPQTDRDPVVMVSWFDAVQFCNWLSRREGLAPFYAVDPEVTGDWSADGYRLPTEAEWEFAARSRGLDMEYAWGNAGPEGNVADETLKKTFPAWHFEIWHGYADGHVYTAPVGSYPPNTIGLCDMSGNVWEWCADWYGSYTAEAQSDPRGPAAGVTRCLRGGGWSDEPGALRVSFRGGRLPNGRGVNSGFRPALSRSVPAGVE